MIENLHGHEIADPYRWLEDPDSERTREWVEAQRARFEEAMAGVGERDWFARTMDAVMRQPRVGTPSRQHGWYLRRTNDGSQDQDVLVGARTLEDLLEGRSRVLLDPNSWSEDGTTSLGAAVVSPDGRLLAHGVSEAGSDWTRIAVLDLDSGELLADEVMAKFSRPVWLPDSSGFLYNAFPEGGRAEGTETRSVSGGHLMLHRMGTDAALDEDLLSFPADPRLLFNAEVFTSEAGDWAVLGLRHGTNRANALWVAPVAGGVLGAWVELLPDEDHERLPIGVVGDELLVQTDAAPMGEVLAVGLPGGGAGEGRARVVVPESDFSLEATVLAGGVLVTQHLVDATPRLRRWGLDGTLLGEVPASGGAVVALDAEADADEVFIGTSSVTDPLVSWWLDARTGVCRRLPGVERTWRPPAVRIERHRARSSDGIEVPYFLVTPEGAGEGPRPTLLYGYGGFAIPVLADYRAGWAGWLAAGGTLAIANLRGGSEFGTQWYEQGRRERKQQVFDDFIAIAEDLVRRGITSTSQLASYGRSNGGLLVGATLAQRPDLFAAAIPQVGVLDVLRFHKFTIGAAWTSDYGDPDVAEDFEVALAYSPLHNLRQGTHYPATLVVTGDHDDRVVPAHSHKFTATLQDAQGDPQAPVISRIEVSTGHGVGKPVGMQASEWADLLAFAAHHTGLRV